MNNLIFGRGNAKLSKDIVTFSLPAGHTCPGAHLCASYADKFTGKIQDGKNTQFRCFAASQESVYPNVRKARWHNFETLQKFKNSSNAMATIILNNIPKDAKIVRIHVSGDFFNAQYFRAWAYVASQLPMTRFYAYTKSVKIVLANKHLIPDNLRLTLSYGGLNDKLISHSGIKSAKVVYSPEEAEALSLDIDHTDELAYNGNNSFALLIHGMQPKGSEASKALKKLKARNVKYSYN